MSTTLVRPRRLTAVLAAVTAAVVGVAACSSGSSASTVRLVAYSVPKPAYDALGKAFAKTKDGKDVEVKGSYGPSGSQSKAVIGGQKADYVGFSVEPDLTKLVDAGKVEKNWNSGPTKGLVSDSVVVIVVRQGNPLGIKGWDDLVKPGVKIVTPDPATSGSAKWNILAAYTHILSEGGTDVAAQAYLKKFYKNIVSRAQSGATATTQFTSGTGNVLISYENEAISARAKGAKLDYIVPEQSILIENPAAVTKGASDGAKKFLSYVESEAGQEIFAAHGFRPVVKSTKIPTVAGANDPSNPFPTVSKLTTIAQLGGWSAVNKKFFDEKTGIVTKIGGAG
ncbi:sulfate transport system substrate-binding protein [Jatrophihabitans endophyticus]|uniref:Sulfate transport system substrate-binding protein n=1 Tax=Jatrophihabitans endophyticus TaxID=1206085 RepID=A0A1M5MJ78_9ACTN|nr:sulfate ABC transporter substrate-binding protein [Jatrophihabitans endophyticus]SHG76803.1 sulfate transport system substrate-binding protein [Jatrophihabitans endophyticus]